MTTPCDKCKHKTERHEGHRVYIGCSDSEKAKSFHYDDFTYHHSCEAFETGGTEMNAIKAYYDNV